MPAVDVRELGLVGRLEPVVELLGDASAQLACGAAKIEARLPRGQTEDQPEKRGQQLAVLQVGTDRGRHPGILDLHRHGATVVQPRGVDLADRGGRERAPVELGKRALGRSAQLALEHLARKLGRHRGRIVAQPTQRRR